MNRWFQQGKAAEVKATSKLKRNQIYWENGSESTWLSSHEWLLLAVTVSYLLEHLPHPFPFTCELDSLPKDQHVPTLLMNTTCDWTRDISALINMLQAIFSTERKSERGRKIKEMNKEGIEKLDECRHGYYICHLF